MDDGTLMATLFMIFLFFAFIAVFFLCKPKKNIRLEIETTQTTSGVSNNPPVIVITPASMFDDLPPSYEEAVSNTYF